MKSVIAFSTAAIALVASPALAQNITQEQSCQKMAEHVVEVLQGRDWASEASGEIAVLQAFIEAQEDAIEAGVTASAAALNMPLSQLQPMVDQQGETIAAQLDRRYGDGLYRDYTVALANCAQAFPDALGSDRQTFATMLQTVGGWAQAGR